MRMPMPMPMRMPMRMPMPMPVRMPAPRAAPVPPERELIGREMYGEDGAPEVVAPAPAADHVAKKARTTAPTKCAYWPNCSKEDCPYIHPTQLCKYVIADVLGARKRGAWEGSSSFLQTNLISQNAHAAHNARTFIRLCRANTALDAPIQSAISRMKQHQQVCCLFHCVLCLCNGL